jgi:hypothetical protein
MEGATAMLFLSTTDNNLRQALPSLHPFIAASARI